MELEECLSIVAAGEDLSQDQAYAVADILASGEVNADSKADFLTQLAQKGESPQEVAGLAKRYRELARDPGLEEWQDRA
ncbi:MAG: anthranilate phosphoribosyltransferase, partial [Verrucomicrobiia bacterium]